MITPYHQEFLKHSLAIWLGSADINNIPDSVRCLGVIVEDETTVRCFIAEKFSSTFLKNLSENKHISLATSHPYTFIGYQYKGQVINISPCTTKEIDFQKKYMDEFAESMAAFGLDKQRVVDMYFYEPSVSIRIKVNAVFEQTPKPNTGQEVKI
jgi:hypothetical protein